MKVYDYDPATGEFLGEIACQESPLEPGTYLMPAHATTLPPPDPRPGYARCFISGAWSYVADHRGETVYRTDDSRKHAEVRGLGDLPAGYVAAAPPDPDAWYKWKGSAWALYTPPPTVADYDKAMEAHLLAERSARGYTLREPSDYKDSSVPRWAQDAADWIAHRDAVMLYGLEIMNHYAETGEAPTLEEFEAGLPVITWTFEDER